MEKRHRRNFEDYGYGTTIWSPLASGILTGKYNSGDIPDDSRFANNEDLKFIWAKYFTGKEKDITIAKLNALGELAKELGVTQA